MLWFDQAPLLFQIPVILIVVFIPAIIIHRVFIRSPRAREYSVGVQATTISTVSLAFALMASFTAVDVSIIFEKAKSEVNREATSLDGAMRLLHLLPAETGKLIHAQLREYITHIARFEWEEMDNRAINTEPMQENLEKAYDLAVLCELDGSGREELRKRLLTCLDNVRNARAARILICKGSVHWLKWSILIILTIVLQIMMGVCHAEKPKARLLLLSLLAFSQAAYIIVIEAMNHPFGGDVTVDPTPLLELLK